MDLDRKVNEERLPILLDGIIQIAAHQVISPNYLGDYKELYMKIGYSTEIKSVVISYEVRHNHEVTSSFDNLNDAIELYNKL